MCQHLVYHMIVIFLNLQAQMVAAATQNLCEAANAMVQGHGTEEKLVSAARQVASSTAQLLVACKVKADADSVAMRRLQVSCFTNKCKEISLVLWLCFIINIWVFLIFPGCGECSKESNGSPGSSCKES